MATKRNETKRAKVYLIQLNPTIIKRFICRACGDCFLLFYSISHSNAKCNLKSSKSQTKLCVFCFLSFSSLNFSTIRFWFSSTEIQIETKKKNLLCCRLSIGKVLRNSVLTNTNRFNDEIKSIQTISSKVFCRRVWMCFVLLGHGRTLKAHLNITWINNLFDWQIDEFKSQLCLIDFHRTNTQNVLSCRSYILRRWHI